MEKKEKITNYAIEKVKKKTRKKQKMAQNHVLLINPQV